MAKYDLNIKKLAFSLLMFPLRSNTVKALIQVLCVAFYGVKARFNSYKNTCDTALSFNSQVVYIEAALNHYLAEHLSSRITVTDDVATAEPIVVRVREEQKPVVTMFLIKARAYWGFRPFVVSVPIALEDNVDVMNRIHAIVQRYKFLGVKYVIKFKI